MAARLTLDQALAIIAAARKRWRESGSPPVAYAVVDHGGNLLCVVREDEAGFLRAQVALNKAWGCFALNFPSRVLRDQVKGWESWFVGIQGAAGGRLVPTLGGVFIRDADGAALGAVGVAGAAGEIDEAIAVHSIEAIGLKADPGGAPAITSAGRPRRARRSAGTGRGVGKAQNRG
jgi:uncharacterized protein GlcG (DUF336 family)